MHKGQRIRLISTIRNNPRTFSHLAAWAGPNITAYRDTGYGWTTLEVLAHLRDFDGFFLHRAKLILAEAHPDLPAYDHEQIAIDERYNEQDPDEVVATLVAGRAAFADWFEALADDDWTRTGQHPERSFPFSLTDALLQVATHDATHIEQMTRILVEKLPAQ